MILRCKLRPFQGETVNPLPQLRRRSRLLPHIDGNPDPYELCGRLLTQGSCFEIVAVLGGRFAFSFARSGIGPDVQQVGRDEAYLSFGIELPSLGGANQRLVSAFLLMTNAARQSGVSDRGRGQGALSFHLAAWNDLRSLSRRLIKRGSSNVRFWEESGTAAFGAAGRDSRHQQVTAFPKNDRISGICSAAKRN